MAGYGKRLGYHFDHDRSFRHRQYDPAGKEPSGLDLFLSYPAVFLPVRISLFHREQPEDFVRKKLRTVVLPYFSLGIVILLYNVYSAVKYNTYTVDWLRETLRRFLIQDRFWTIWFLAAVLVLNVMMYLMVRFLKKTWALAAAAAVFAAAGLLYYHFGGDKLPWDVDVAFCAMPFFCGGFLLRRHSAFFASLLRGKGRLAVAFFVCLGLNILICWLNYHFTKTVCDMFSMRYGIAPLMYLSAFSGIGAVIILSRRLIWRPICFIGENSLVFFALHQEIAMPIAKNLLSNVRFIIVAGDPIWKMLLYWGAELMLMLLILTAIVKLINATSLRFLIGKK